MVTNKTYARIENDRIVEYPVTTRHLEVRGHVPEMYALCIFEVQPEFTEYQYSPETYRILHLEDGGHQVLVGYKVVDSEFETLLNILWDNQLLSGNLDGLVAPAIATVPVDLIKAIQKQTIARVQNRLDVFAATKGYDGILSACSYANSAKVNFKADSDRAIFLRDATWAALYTTMDEILAETRPLPKSFSDIEAELPALTWS